ncbi:MAG: carbonic anhydrase, partial [Bdellovibrionales bacterium]
MSRKELLRLVSGFRRFREKYFDPEDSLYRKAGQAPKTLVIGCSDSRVDPAIITSSGPGELFVVRNVANLVPPYETGGGLHGVSAAIEFAIVNLKVENVVILGHRQCGGIRALVTGLQSDS